jgi:hypothetical protein
MPIVDNPRLTSPPLVCYEFDVQGLVGGANAISLPTTYGAFPPDGEWTPIMIECYPYQAGAQGNLVTPDYNTIVNTNGVITFTLYAGDATNCRLRVY